MKKTDLKTTSKTTRPFKIDSMYAMTCHITMKSRYINNPYIYIYIMDTCVKVGLNVKRGGLEKIDGGTATKGEFGDLNYKVREVHTRWMRK